MIRGLISRLLHGAPSEEARLLTTASRTPRFSPRTFTYRGYSLKVTDMLSVAWQIQEFFVEERLKFTARDVPPVIVDCGANVGMSVLYQRSVHPSARIICFEPDPKVYACLEENLRVNGIQGVECRREAVWINNEGVTFASEGADGGSISDKGEQVVSVRLRDVLQQLPVVDLLKIDIEGAETDVLLDCDGHLANVRNLYVEYHSMRSEPQRLHDLLNLLQRNGFRYYIHRIGVHHQQPFVELEPGVMDMQLDIHAVRS